MRTAIAIFLLLLSPAAAAGEADVLQATARAAGDGRWTVSATIKHADAGWDHYADAFQVVAPDGTVLGTRVLYHPHVQEQPFTRSLTRVEIPENLDYVMVRAGDKVHGYGGQEFRLELKR